MGVTIAETLGPLLPCAMFGRDGTLVRVGTAKLAAADQVTQLRQTVPDHVGLCFC